MKLQLQITTRDIPHSDALESHIRQKAEKLETFYPQIMGCRIVVEVPHKHKHQGNLFNVRLDITVPGKELVVTREPNEDVYVALRDAFDAAKRQLEDYGRRQRGEVKAHAPVLHGKVVRLMPEEGYGFVETSSGQELYFHRENLANNNFEQLEEGSEVQFLEDIGSEGFQAKRVSTGKRQVEEPEEAEPRLTGSAD
ncbi:ribosomal subunit interface protein [Nitrosospira multiformis ATCC 25196]|uniref:Ribosomal subunit interface protein n=1 Tax=Nitrosospira multiformis (strain ATCC 25196 / NCIMB 11849 / C 71) TaxID=323848 RepID=Q2YAL3_NITMU|nr:HPF/RaiA family ribosome-associated protein [Nitrosospira multiformis]ABB74208.1 putative sigma 54 modulation protein/ribosomal protein S30EA [Nitrosospira multiformis ATCC 25196]SEF47572.1 ribosomal subunit interface protein [Nitrosospira multiformis ATCC 25196]